MKEIHPIKALCSVFLFAHLFSCEIETQWELDTFNTEYIVVNGLITNEKKAHDIILNHPVNQLNEISKPLSGAFVLIYDGDSLHLLEEKPLFSGIYKTDTNFRAFINKTYNLIIAKDDNRYFSTATILPVSPFRPLRYKYDTGIEMFTIDSVCQPFDTKESAMYEISIDWTSVPGYDTIKTEDKKARLYYYSLFTLDVSEVFEPQKEKIYFPAGTTIVERKYSLSPDHARFIRSMLLETEWRGGLFDVAHANVYSNMSHGAIGFFGGCTVLEQTIIVN